MTIINILWEILIPTTKNGKEISKDTHEKWINKVKDISGGLTITLTKNKGYWSSPEGKIFIDNMLPVRIMCNEEEIDKVADTIAKHYDQKAVLFYRISEYAKLKHYKKEEETIKKVKPVVYPERTKKSCKIHKGIDRK